MNMRRQEAIGWRSDVLTGPRGRRSGQINVLLCLSTAAASGSSSWVGGSPDVHKHTRTINAYNTERDLFNLGPLPLLQ